MANVNKRIAALDDEEEEAKIDEEEAKEFIGEKPEEEPEGEEMIMGAGSKENIEAQYKNKVDNLIIPGDEYY